MDNFSKIMLEIECINGIKKKNGISCPCGLSGETSRLGLGSRQYHAPFYVRIRKRTIFLPFPPCKNALEISDVFFTQIEKLDGVTSLDWRNSTLILGLTSGWIHRRDFTKKIKIKNKNSTNLKSSFFLLIKKNLLIIYVYL